jgi:urea transport system permease protein
MIGVVPSIEMVIWVAVGGRASLIGPVIGALLVNGAKSGLSETFPLFWQYLLGAMFVGSVLFFPTGIYGVFCWLNARWLSTRASEVGERSAALHPGGSRA